MIVPDGSGLCIASEPDFLGWAVSLFTLLSRNSGDPSVWLVLCAGWEFPPLCE